MLPPFHKRLCNEGDVIDRCDPHPVLPVKSETQPLRKPSEPLVRISSKDDGRFKNDVVFQQLYDNVPPRFPRIGIPMAGRRFVGVRLEHGPAGVDDVIFGMDQPHLRVPI